MDQSTSRGRDVVIRTVVTHTVTYFVAGVASFFLFDYATAIAETELRLFMRPVSHPMVVAGPLVQPVRGFLFGIVFVILREPFFERDRGWLGMWTVLVSLGILGTFGATPGSLEGIVYSVLPLPLHLRMLPEIMAQSFLLSWLLFVWVRHPERRWLNWTMGAAFVVVLLISGLGLAATLRRAQAEEDALISMSLTSRGTTPHCSCALRTPECEGRVSGCRTARWDQRGG